MTEEEPQRGTFVTRRERQLRLNLFELVFLGAMLFVLILTSVDALDGQNIGKSDALDIAKLQGQQELMASVFKTK